MQSLQKFLKYQNAPILVLILCNIVAGILTVKTYGLTLDEPYYYSYGESIGYAYSPTEWFSGNFDLENSYGPSKWDHRDRGPAYLLLARVPAKLLETYAGFDLASAWHFVNFLTFQVGLFFLYHFLQRWVSKEASITTTAFFMLQPIIWGHSFINPKDMPFLVFFLMSIELGFRMAENLSALTEKTPARLIFKIIIVPAIVMGLATNMRILGPLSGILVFIYYLQLGKRTRWLWFIPYGLIGFAAFLFCWPYIWQDTLQRISEILLFMSDNPTELKVLFYGQIFTADQLPLRYLPTLLLITLTEPFWILTIFGFILSAYQWKQNKQATQTLLLCLVWFFLPLAYVLIRRPAMYDGFRHFLFILPPLFILIGIGVDFLFTRAKHNWIKILIAGFLIAPGLLSIVKLFPYEYAYYNQFVGGTGQASFNFETDYWSTCYKEALEIASQPQKNVKRIIVSPKGIPIMQYFLHEKESDIKVYASGVQVLWGDALIFSARANKVIQMYRTVDDDAIWITRDGAIFCRIRIPKPIE